MSGALNTTLILALLMLAALRPPMPRRSSPFNLQFALGWWINELPAIALYWLAAGTLGTLLDPRAEELWWWLVAGTAAADLLLIIVLTLRARSARPALAAAFRATYGPGAEPSATRVPWWRFLWPILAWRPDVRRIRNRRYGPARRGNRLDVYVSRRARIGEGSKDGDGRAPVFVYVHGGAFVMGTKMLGARPLLYRLAAQGWVCASIDYRQLHARYPDQLADARAALAWIRENVAAYGGDPDAIFLAGGSAGAHLAATVALTEAGNTENTTVRGVVGFYGYYGSVGRTGSAPSSPRECITADAPPFLLVHGAQDTLVLPRDARAFADQLRATSTNPVVYAELPRTQHNFDFFHSLRLHAVTAAVIRFAELNRSR